jgi:hypothetical protein
MEFKIENCKIRKVNEMDYENYIVMINEFKPTKFTRE